MKYSKETLKFYASSATMMFGLLLMLTACGTTSEIKTSSAVCPAPIIISEDEQNVLRSEIPDFYLRFTNQQLDLMEIE